MTKTTVKKNGVESKRLKVSDLSRGEVFSVNGGLYMRLASNGPLYKAICLSGDNQGLRFFETDDPFVDVVYESCDYVLKAKA